MFETLLLDFIARHYRDAAHSIFAPSASHMWMTCSGSLIPNLIAPDNAGIEAAEGTVAHEIGEQWLKTGERPSERIGEIVRIEEGRNTFEIEITRSMLDYVEDYVVWCMNQPGTHYVEQRVFFSQYTPIPNQGGRMDFAAARRHALNITDLKYGEGVQVYAENNPQGMLYALGFFLKWDWLYDFQEITIRIAQPRRDHMDVWETDRKTLLAFARKVKATAKAAWTLNAPLKPSEKACQFCKVKAFCPAFLKIAEDISKDCFADLNNPIEREAASDAVQSAEAGLFDPQLEKPVLLTTKAMANALPFRGAFEKWFSEVESELEQRALDGHEIPGRKLVEARTNRVFADERKAVDRLGEAGVHWTHLYSTKFTSPAQAEELLRKFGMKKADAVEFLSPVVRKPPGKPTLVPESDKRPAYVPPAADVFDDLDADDDEL